MKYIYVDTEVEAKAELEARKQDRWHGYIMACAGYWELRVWK